MVAQQSAHVPPDAALEAYTEAYSVLQKYFTSDCVDHDGKFWSIRDVPVTMKPLQQPQPPMWYACATPDSAAWPAHNGVNVICGGPVDKVHLISGRYRAEAAEGGTAASGDALLGICRFVVVGETDEAAQRIAQQAWPRFHESFYKLWRKHGTEPQRLRLGADYAAMMASGHGIAGSPATVTEALIRQLRDSRLNYLMAHFMFGDMPHQGAQQSVRLFASEVMPAVTEASRSWL